MRWYDASCDGDVTRAGCGDRFCLEGSECDTAVWLLSVQWRSYDGECTFRETLRDGSMLPCRSGED